MITMIIFSKDRACQLDLLLRSIKKQIQDYENLDINVIYKATTDYFDKGYSVVKDEHSEFSFHRETDNVKSDIMRILDDAGRLVCFLCDDNIFTRPIGSEEYARFEKFIVDNSALCFSMRLGKNITGHYELGEIPQQPIVGGRFQWISGKGDWGYPGSVEGNLFRREEMVNALNGIEFKHPCIIECVLNPMLVNTYRNKPYMHVFDFPRLMNVPDNRVNDAVINKAENTSTEHLIKMNYEYINGKRLKYGYDGYVNKFCHEPVGFDWEAK